MLLFSECLSECRRPRVALLPLLLLMVIQGASAADDKQLDNKAQKLRNMAHQSPSVNACFSKPDALFPTDLEGQELRAAEGKGILGVSTSLNRSVELRFNGVKLTANHLHMDSSTGQFSATGGINLNNRFGEFTADSANGNRQASQLDHAEFRLGLNGANGGAQSITLNQNQVTMQGLSFSTCPTGDNSWRLFAEDIHIDNQKGWAEAQDVTLRIADIPVLYLPWLMFPIDDKRHTGILPPSFGSNERTGFDVSQPIYLNLAENYDATLTPRYMTDRGLQLGTEFRYLHHNQSGQVALEYLNDRADNRENRWSYQTEYQAFIDDHWRFRLDASGVSDNNYYADLGSGLGLANRDQLTRRASFDYQTQNLSARASWLQFQPLTFAGEPYRHLPQLSLAWFDGSSDGHWYWQIGSEYSRFSSTTENFTQAERLTNRVELSHRASSNWGYLVTTGRGIYNQYEQTFHTQSGITLTQQNPTFSATQLSLEGGLYFARSRDGGSQTLEPKIKVLYSDATDQTRVGLYDTYRPLMSWQQLFADNRFSGRDRIGDTEQISLGVKSRILDKNHREQGSFSIGQVFYFADRQIQLTDTPRETRRYSDIVASAEWRPSEALTTRIDWVLDPERNETAQGKFDLNYEPNDDLMVKISHRFIDTQAGYKEQSDLGLTMPISPRWRLISRWQYDLIDKRSFETMAGIEYQSCCWTIRVISRRYLNARLDPNGGIIPDPAGQFNSDIQLQFVLRGLGQSDTSEFGRMLNSSLWSY